MIPGMNLLAAALTLIGPQGVEWHPFASRTQNAKGDWVASYGTPSALWGSWQPVPKEKYQELGLDLNRHYFLFYTTAAVEGVERATSGDKLVKDGRAYQVEDSNGDWLLIDGWRGVLCVDIGAAA